MFCTYVQENQQKLILKLDPLDSLNIFVPRFSKIIDSDAFKTFIIINKVIHKIRHGNNLKNGQNYSINT